MNRSASINSCPRCLKPGNYKTHVRQTQYKNIESDLSNVSYSKSSTTSFPIPEYYKRNEAGVSNLVKLRSSTHFPNDSLIYDLPPGKSLINSEVVETFEPSQENYLDFNNFRRPHSAVQIDHPFNDGQHVESNSSNDTKDSSIQPNKFPINYTSSIIKNITHNQRQNSDFKDTFKNVIYKSLFHIHVYLFFSIYFQQTSVSVTQQQQGYLRGHKLKKFVNLNKETGNEILNNYSKKDLLFIM